MIQGKLQIAIVPQKRTKRKVGWGEVVNGFKVYACSAPQLRALESTAKYTFCFAGTGGGKTAIVPLKLYSWILSKGGKGRYLIVSPTIPTFEQSQLKQHIKSVFADTPLQGVWSDQKKTYTIPSGAEIVVRTAQTDADVKALTGGQYDGVALDECWALSKGVWEEVRRRSNILDAPVFGVTTPNVDGWLFAEIQTEHDADNPDYQVIRWATQDNPVKDVAEHQKFLDSELAKLGEATFRRMYCGEFTRLEGLVFPAFSDPKAPEYPVVTAELPSPPARFFGMIDWGYRPDPAAILICAECENGNSYIVEEAFEYEKTHAELAAIAKGLVDRWGVKDDGSGTTRGRFIGFACDASRPEAVKAFRQFGLTIRKRKVDDILAGLTITDSWFRANRLFVFDTCKNLIRECRAYQWNKDRAGDLKQVASEKNNHAIDALRYGISTFKYHDKPITPVYEPPTEQEEQAKLERLGLLRPVEDMKEIEAERQKQRFNEMAFGNGFDDDPYSIWG
jgi:hypothetical protein